MATTSPSSTRYHAIGNLPSQSMSVAMVSALSSSGSTSSKNTRDLHRAVMASAALVTGSTDGIGITTAKRLASDPWKYTVLIHGRDSVRIQQAQNVVQSFMAKTNPTTQDNVSTSSSSSCYALPPVDLSTIQGAMRLATEVEQLCQEHNLALTVLMNNAGVFSEDHVITDDGLELTFAVNVVATFILTSMLLPTLVRNSSNQQTRIVIASSISQCRSIRNWDDMQYQQRPYSAHAAYSESKLLDAMLTMEMAARLQDAGLGMDRITCNCLDPGTVNTKMLLAGWGPCGIDVDDALDQTWLCTSPDVDHVTGRYFVYRSDRRASADAYNKQERQKLWNLLSVLAPEAAQMWTFDWLENEKE